MSVPVTAIVATRNEAANIGRCLDSLRPAARVIVVDSGSSDATGVIAREHGAEVVEFCSPGGYPKKRQWAMDTCGIETEWTLLVDADEVIPDSLWREIGEAIASPLPATGYFIVKGFHFLGRRFRHGGFSFRALLLFRTGRARFERINDDPACALDMEVHERLIVDGSTAALRTPLVHDDFKGLHAYYDKHNKYSTWEAQVRTLLRASTVASNPAAVQARLTGNVQERRRFLKLLAARMPFEPSLWFLYHYFLRLGFLEGRAGFIASRIRSQYIAQVRAKIYELSMPGRAA